MLHFLAWLIMSTHYMDSEYLFLMIDYVDENKLLILERTLQPIKFNGKLLSDDERYRLDSFNKRRYYAT
jgi:hypothetical protein